MPKRKISISEALSVLKEHNLEVTTKVVEPQKVMSVTTEKPIVKRIGTTAVTINLYAQHMIGKGGTLKVLESGEQTTDGNEFVVYGPGTCTVPSTIAGQLLHQDQLLKQADDKMTDGIQRSYLIMQRRGYDGAIVNVGVQVDNNLMVSSREDLQRMNTMVV